jgi:hypothetical protein
VRLVSLIGGATGGLSTSLSNVASVAAHPKCVWVLNANYDGTIIYNDPVPTHNNRGTKNKLKFVKYIVQTKFFCILRALSFLNVSALSKILIGRPAFDKVSFPNPNYWRSLIRVSESFSSLQRNLNAVPYVAYDQYRLSASTIGPDCQSWTHVMSRVRLSKSVFATSKSPLPPFTVD